jgi:uncharacterized SAM-binding protein YcdF (DUF218 family)
LDWALFLGKKLVLAALYPVGTAVLLWLCGTILWLRRPQSRTGPTVVAMGAVWLVVLSLPLTSHFLLHSLEQRAGSYANPARLNSQGVRHIVVLGGDVRAGNLTPTDRAANTSLVRVLEGVRLWKQMPDAKLVLSGGRYSSRMMTTAEAMEHVAVQVGVTRDSIVLETKSWDTGGEARELKAMLTEKPFALVTSAFHMQRAIMVFRSAGLTPTPAPADFRTFGYRSGLWSIVPSVHSLAQSTSAIHEYLGISAGLVKQLVLGSVARKGR